MDHGCLFCTLGYNAVLLYFLAQIVPALATGSSAGSQVLLTYPIMVPPPPFVLNTFFLSGSTRWSCSSLDSLPSPRISHFSREPCFLLLESGTRNWDLVCSLLLRFGASGPFQLTQQRAILCTVAHVCTHIYRYFHLYPHASIVSHTWVHTDGSNSYLLPHGSLELSPLAWLNFHFNSEKSGSHNPPFIYLIVQVLYTICSGLELFTNAHCEKWFYQQNLHAVPFVFGLTFCTYF